ncbi:MAG: hypothetical protein ACPG77_14625, partial [Nannocystaceae bacterium]
ARHLNRTKEILANLLAFPTLSGSSNLEMIAYLRDRLEAAGAREIKWGITSVTPTQAFMSASWK